MPHPLEQEARHDDEQPQPQPQPQPQSQSQPKSQPQHPQRHPSHPPAHHPNLECGNWQLLSPPGDYQQHRHRRRQHDEERLQIGLIQCHPSLLRLAYTTRRPSHLGLDDDDLGSSQVVIQDYEDTLSHECPDANGRVVCAFFLRELVEKINDHRSARGVVGAAPLTATSLGAIQHLAFLDREALREVVPRHLVRDDPPPDGMHQLLIGFRRCLVAASLFRLKDQSEPHARGITVRLFLGPEDPRQYRVDEEDEEEKGRTWSEAAWKQWKRQPSSFAAPVSEHVLAYGCYDGGLRFYDSIGRRQAKSALGPNGRNVPIVKVINANPSRNTTNNAQPQRPRIVCAGSNGVGYLWELELSVDASTGQITSFDIPPPLATFDALAAVVPRTLSEDFPTSDLHPIAIAPTSTHSQMDRFHSQFEPTFDPHRNLLVWIYSSDGIAAATGRRGAAARQDVRGYLLAWDLTAVPPPSWPPPARPPAALAPLPSPDATCRLTVPGIANGAESIDSFLVAAYVAASSGELMAFAVDVDARSARRGDKREDDVTDCELAEVSKYGNRCYSLAKARNQPYQIFLGTQHGILMARIAASYDELEHDLFTIGEDQSVMELESLSYCSLREEEHEKEREVATQSPSRNHPDVYHHSSVHASANYDREDQSFMDLESLSHFSYQTQDYVKPPPRPIPTDDPPPPPPAKPTSDAASIPAASSSSAPASAEIQRLKTKLSKLELRNAELEEELQRKSLLLETQPSSAPNDPQQLALKARMAAVLEQQRRYQDVAKKEVEASRSQIEKLEYRLSSQEEKYDALEAEAEKMRRELTNVGSMLEKERSLNQSANAQLRSLMAEIKNLEQELASMTSWKEELEAENAEWSRRLEGSRDATNNGTLGGASQSTTSNTNSHSHNHSDSSKSKEPRDAPNEAVKAAEDADLRSYIQLLEADKHAKDRELEEARFDAEEDAKLIAKLQSDAREQKLSIESLVELLDGEKKDHERELSAKKEEIDSLREELEDVQKKLEGEIMNSGRIISHCRAGNDKIASQREEIERLRLENSAVRRDLQDALDDLKVYRK